MINFHVQVVGKCSLVNSQIEKNSSHERKSLIIDNKLKFGGFLLNLIILDNKLIYARQQTKFGGLYE